MPDQNVAYPWWSKIAPRFRYWTTEELAARSKETGIKYVHGFSYESLMIHAPHYVQFLYRTFIANGGFVQLSELLHIQQSWDGSVSTTPSVVVNCSGLGSKVMGGVTDATMFADRGQTIRVFAPKVTDIWRAPGRDATYILPRGDGTVILGGTHIKRESVHCRH